MTNKEALVRFRGDLELMKMASTHKTKQMEMYECAIKALEKQEKKEKPVVYDLSKYPLCNARGEALCEALKGDYCTYEGNCPNKGRKRRIRRADNEQRFN